MTRRHLWREHIQHVARVTGKSLRQVMKEESQVWPVVQTGGMMKKSCGGERCGSSVVGRLRNTAKPPYTLFVRCTTSGHDFVTDKTSREGGVSAVKHVESGSRSKIRNRTHFYSCVKISNIQTLMNHSFCLGKTDWVFILVPTKYVHESFPLREADAKYPHLSEGHAYNVSRLIYDINTAGKGNSQLRSLHAAHTVGEYLIFGKAPIAMRVKRTQDGRGDFQFHRLQSLDKVIKLLSADSSTENTRRATTDFDKRIAGSPGKLSSSFSRDNTSLWSGNTNNGMSNLINILVPSQKTRVLTLLKRLDQKRLRKSRKHK